MSNYIKDGIDNIWLPYTQMKNTDLPLAVKTAKGSVIELEDGTKLIDGIASWWSVCHGYGNKHIVKEMQQQVQKISHIMFAGLGHEQAYKLAKRLAAFTPKNEEKNLNKVFFSESGSCAVEIAMKMAVQFWNNQGNKNKNKFISFKNGYHGDTMGALSLGDPEGWTAKAFNNYAPHNFNIDIPKDELAFTELDELFGDIKNQVAGIIIEPLIQGAGGLKFHSADILAEIYRIAKKHDLLFIADEVMTGFYRTGSKFACDEAGIVPDIMCLGKAISAGMLPLAATIATDEVFAEFLGDGLEKAFLHGPTFMANPVACSAANASLDLFEKEDTLGKIENIEKFFIKNFEKYKDHSKVQQVRVKGAIGVIQLKFESEKEMWETAFKMRKDFVKQGIWLRPFKDVIYVMPNYNITDNELKKIDNAIEKVLSKLN